MLQQWRKGPALLRLRFATMVQRGNGICNGNYAEPFTPDVLCSSGL